VSAPEPSPQRETDAERDARLLEWVEQGLADEGAAVSAEVGDALVAVNELAEND
jgi:hypothetical protein